MTKKLVVLWIPTVASETELHTIEAGLKMLSDHQLDVLNCYNFSRAADVIAQIWLMLGIDLQEEPVNGI